jgi:hypothetical protein
MTAKYHYIPVLFTVRAEDARKAGEEVGKILPFDPDSNDDHGVESWEVMHSKEAAEGAGQEWSLDPDATYGVVNDKATEAMISMIIDAVVDHLNVPSGYGRDMLAAAVWKTVDGDDA